MTNYFEIAKKYSENNQDIIATMLTPKKNFYRDDYWIEEWAEEDFYDLACELSKSVSSEKIEAADHFTSQLCDGEQTNV